MNTNNIVMSVILQNNAGWDCFRILILREILKIQNLLLEEHCASLEDLCSKKLDVQETNISFTQFNRIRNHFLARWTETGTRFPPDMCDLIVLVF